MVSSLQQRLSSSSAGNMSKSASGASIHAENTLAKKVAAAN
jgi:hypothetical protein